MLLGAADKGKQGNHEREKKTPASHAITIVNGRQRQIDCEVVGDAADYRAATESVFMAARAFLVPNPRKSAARKPVGRFGRLN